jgi:fibronectin-binding autotransporter adhesin
VDSDGTTLTLSGSIDGGGLAKTGPGTLVLSGTNTYTGGTTVQAGLLEIGGINALPAGGSLTIDGTGSVVLASGLGVVGDAGMSHEAPMTGGKASPAPVPEPGTLVLLAVGALAGAVVYRRKRTR